MWKSPRRHHNMANISDQSRVPLAHWLSACPNHILVPSDIIPIERWETLVCPYQSGHSTLVY